MTTKWSFFGWGEGGVVAAAMPEIKSGQQSSGSLHVTPVIFPKFFQHHFFFSGHALKINQTEQH